jgi:hypothetical protein
VPDWRPEAAAPETHALHDPRTTDGPVEGVREEHPMSAGPGRPRRGGDTRRCVRAGCTRHATTTLRFLPTRRAARLGPVGGSAAPGHADLCDHHARVLVLPRGWSLDDRRVDAGRLHGDDGSGADEDDPHLSRLLDATTPLLRRAFDNTRTGEPPARPHVPGASRRSRYDIGSSSTS